MWRLNLIWKMDILNWASSNIGRENQIKRVFSHWKTNKNIIDRHHESVIQKTSLLHRCFVVRGATYKASALSAANLMRCLNLTVITFRFYALPVATVGVKLLRNEKLNAIEYLYFYSIQLSDIMKLFLKDWFRQKNQRPEDLCEAF